MALQIPETLPDGTAWKTPGGGGDIEKITQVAFPFTWTLLVAVIGSLIANRLSAPTHYTIQVLDQDNQEQA